MNPHSFLFDAETGLPVASANHSMAPHLASLGNPLGGEEQTDEENTKDLVEFVAVLHYCDMLKWNDKTHECLVVDTVDFMRL
jgi:hypothetical protein